MTFQITFVLGLYKSTFSFDMSNLVVNLSTDLMAFMWIKLFSGSLGQEISFF
jgi:hypothetical protein